MQTRRGLFKMLAAAIVGLKAAPVVAKALEPELDVLNVTTLKYMSEPILADNIFVKSPIFLKSRQMGMTSMVSMAYKQNLLDSKFSQYFQFDGGKYIQTPFTHALDGITTPSSVDVV